VYAVGQNDFNGRSTAMRTHRKTEDTLKTPWTDIGVCNTKKTNGKRAGSDRLGEMNLQLLVKQQVDYKIVSALW
jgi:hypothetical protein